METRSRRFLAPVWALLCLLPGPSFSGASQPLVENPLIPSPTALPWDGKRLYAFDAMWGSKGSGPTQLNDPEGIAVSPDGRIFIADTGNNRIQVWSADGEPITSYGSFGTSADWRNPPQFNHPEAVYVHPSLQIYVSDTLNNRIVVLDNKGLVSTTWGTQGSATSQFNLPRAIAKDRLGDIWVLDSGNSRVQIFSNLGVFNSAWGVFGTDASSNTATAVLNTPLGMALNNIDQCLIADTGNFRMGVYNNGGVPVTVQGWYGDDGPYEFKDPSGVAVTPSGIAAIADGISGRVVFYNSRNGDFEFLSEWRAQDDMPVSPSPPRFRGIACDPSGRLYVTDVQNDRVIRLKPLMAEGGPLIFQATPTPPETSPFGGAGYPIR
jgi:streptogramin lyase